ncbi:MAG TPA: hypothetical protein VJC21_00305 [Candidatus Nanoarchaeia archaeon]|nr:hypothetical protein [Candidatus Nanoarchaeia archaeon]
MGTDTYMEVPEGIRNVFLEENIAGKLPSEQRDSAKERARNIIEDYKSREIDALSILAYAAEQGRFNEFAKRLEEHHKINLQYVHPEARRTVQVPGTLRAERFFVECYGALGIEQKL